LAIRIHALLDDEKCFEAVRELRRPKSKYRLNALVAPIAGPAWCTDPINGDHAPGGSSGPAAVAGYPNINVPAGYAWGLPVGISFFGAANSEALPIKPAYSFAQATRHRRAPKFLPWIS